MIEERPVVVDDAAHVDLRLTPDEVALVVTALRVLRNMLGREEADELAEVQRVLAKLEAARTGPAAPAG